MLPYNECIFIGNFVSEPTFSKVGENNDVSKAEFNIAVDRDNANFLKEKKLQSVDYIPFEALGKIAESIESKFKNGSFKKGSSIFIVGKLHIDRQVKDSNDGKLKTVEWTKIIVTDYR